MSVGSPLLGFVAGVLSILSPCVLPILPVVLGAAASEHRGGTVALACGLAISFVALGLLLATIGYSIGLDAERLRSVAAVLIVAIGVVLVSPLLQTRFAVAAGPAGNWADRKFGILRRHGLSGQLVIGLLLGAVWSPCVGPTLGAASLLAAQGRDLVQVAATMFAFGAGAAVPLLLLGWLSRQTMMRWRNRMLSASSGLKAGLGFAFVAVGILVISGLDKVVETRLVEASPQWLTDFTTRF